MGWFFTVKPTLQQNTLWAAEENQTHWEIIFLEIVIIKEFHSIGDSNRKGETEVKSLSHGVAATDGCGRLGREGAHNDFHNDRHRLTSTTYVIYIPSTDTRDFYKMHACLLPGYALHHANCIQQLKCSLGNARTNKVYLQGRKKKRNKARKWNLFRWNPQKETTEQNHF